MRLLTYGLKIERLSIIFRSSPTIRLKLSFIWWVVKARRYIPIAIIKKMEMLDCRSDKVQ